MRSFAISRPALTCWSRKLIGAMALAGLWSSQIVAAPKTDVVVLVNGDRITGEVKQLERGILTYGTDFMGTLVYDRENDPENDQERPLPAAVSGT